MVSEPEMVAALGLVLAHGIYMPPNPRCDQGRRRRLHPEEGCVIAEPQVCSTNVAPMRAPRCHPHVHGIVPGGGLAPNGKSWIACRPGFFLSVRVLSRLFRRRLLEELLRLHQAGKLQFFGEHTPLADADAFKAWLAPLRKIEWVVYAKKPSPDRRRCLRICRATRIGWRSPTAG